MNRRLYWKLCLVIATAVVALFYVISLLTSQTEDGMSYLALDDRQKLNEWGAQAERLYLNGDQQALDSWANALAEQEETSVVIASHKITHLAGSKAMERLHDGYNMGRNVEWKIHLYFTANPVMEVPFKAKEASFLIRLPDRMRPGVYWRHTKVAFQIILPTILLALLTFMLYRHILKPLSQLQIATKHFSKGDFQTRAQELVGDRNDDFSDLASAFDQMAIRIGEQIISQRQLIADLSHELRTPLTRLDIALEAVKSTADVADNIDRIDRESKHIRKLVEDTLNLAWLENEQPELQQESLELIDLLDVLVEDARFEFPDRQIVCDFLDSAVVENSSHRAAGQGIENILRNALRYTPSGKTVTIKVSENDNDVYIKIIDQGPGVPDKYLATIFKPFFRVDKSRAAQGNSFGLGLALARRQLAAIRAQVIASNVATGGLLMTIKVPKA
ncbi:MAG: histidine kinase sensor domain-containing protein [Gammaproteobacteria bacterium]|nr:histidine kinase sensor domain-containing protein [Gammaproteobacteria bacterium]